MSVDKEYNNPSPPLVEELASPKPGLKGFWDVPAILAALAQSHSNDEIAQVILEAGKTTLQAKRGFLALVSEEGSNQLKIVDTIGYPQNLLPDKPVITLTPAQTSPLTTALASLQPVWLENYYGIEESELSGGDEELGARVSTAGSNSALAVLPLVIEGRVLGIVNFSFSPPHSFSAEEKALILILAGQASLALERVRLYLAEREARLQAEKALETAHQLQAISDPVLAYLEFNPLLHELLNRLRLALASETATLLLLDEQGKNLTVHISTGLAEEMGHFAVVPVGKGFSGWIAAIRKAVVVDDLSTIEVVGQFLRERVTSVMGAPLLLGKQVLGVVHVGMTHTHHYNEDDLALLELAAYRMALAIDQARLYEAERQARFKAEIAQDRLAFLAKVSEVLNVSLNYHSTLNDLAHLFVSGLADFCLIDLIDEKNGQFYDAIAAHKEPVKEKIIEEGLQHYPSAPNANENLTQLLQGDKAFLIPKVEPERLKEIALSAAHLKLLEQLAPTSLILTPVLLRGQGRGIVILAQTSDQSFKEEDLTLVEEVTRRAALALDNARLYEESQKAIRDRDTFLSVAAHELKTPITSLKGFAQLLSRRLVHQDKEKGEINSERFVKGLEAINTQSDKLATLVNQLLDVSRIEVGKLNLEPSRVNLNELVKGAVDLVQSETSRHTLDLALPEQVIAEVDPIRFEQVIINLLSNAVKYSPEGGRVAVSLSYVANNDNIRFLVRDWGLGIPPEHRSQIFNRFYQAHQPRHLGGMGLGLYITRQIVELHGGRIEVQFPEDGGSCFEVTLPVRLHELNRGSKKTG
jgi:K+-sensing histidine kinase KdpD